MIRRTDNEVILVILGMQLLDECGIRFSAYMSSLLDAAHEASSASNNLGIVVHTVKIKTSLHSVRCHIHLVVGPVLLGCVFECLI